ncbi:MAG: DUF4097 family beta strand repeat-containing protein [Chloroflexota bacterium]|nr:DUF4097 family beta strand repeat-containing protein [Chloroflexota bacterium]
MLNWRIPGTIVIVSVVIIWILIAIAVVTGAGFLVMSASDRTVQGWSNSIATMKRETVKQDVEYREPASLELDTFAGQVLVEVADIDTIQIIATKVAAKQEDLEKIDIKIVPRDGRVLIETVRPAGLRDVGVDFVITTPPGVDLNLRTGSGSVTANGRHGDVWVRSDSGAVTVGGSQGDVVAESSSGAVMVSGSRGDVQATSGSGHIRLQRLSGSINAHTESGRVEATGVSGQVRLSSSSGNIDYRGDPMGDCRFETGSGSVRLALPAALNAMVDVQTGSGKVEMGYDITGQRGHQSVKGTIGSGKAARIYVRTPSGNITLEKQ